jgi:hypothetical protein
MVDETLINGCFQGRVDGRAGNNGSYVSVVLHAHGGEGCSNSDVNDINTHSKRLIQGIRLKTPRMIGSRWMDRSRMSEDFERPVDQCPRLAIRGRGETGDG